MTKRTWARMILLPPLLLGVVVYAALFVVTGGELAEHVQEPMASLPEPCAMVPEKEFVKLFPKGAPEGRRGGVDSSDQFVHLDDPSEKELRRGQRVCRWVPNLEPQERTLYYPDEARGLHVELRQYEGKRSARYVYNNLPWGREIDVPGANNAVLRNTEYTVEWDDESGMNGEDESTSSIVARKGNILVMVVFGQAYKGDYRNYSDQVSRRDGIDGITAVTERVIRELSEGAAQ